MARRIQRGLAISVLFLTGVCMARVIIMRGGILIRPGQAGQQVENIAHTVDDAAPNPMALRDAAETNLLALGESAIDAIKTSADNHTGLARDALRVALFRLQNQLTPQDIFTAWIRKKNDKQVAPKVAHIISDELLRVFPHHLFYTVEIPGERSVVALASDGKVQDVSDDAGLAKFLKNELPDEKGTAARGHAVSAALELTLARQLRVLKLEEVTREVSEKSASATVLQGAWTGRAQVDFADDGSVSAVKTALEMDAVEPAAATAPAATIPG